ncbi:NAD-P-binding protein [Collybia nuda]|uniref:NAD-P-binding protein n=1 Tax=Collybia nuda TaxID=64659 RepID=A0A9P5Y6R1_9AGAR|nr:NAD-P-binding protein [Collybia nuda]
MSRLLLTGASGYIAGALLNDVIQLPDLIVFALVRTPQQAEKVTSLGVTPLQFDMSDGHAVEEVLVKYSITVVIQSADAFNFAPGKAFINGLKAVKNKLGKEVHYIHTSGAKLFSSHVGIHQLLNDADDDVYSIEKSHESPHEVLQTAVNTNISINDLADSLDVRSYILVPPMVYGPGTGFGNKISIQYVAIIRMGRDLGEVFQVADDTSTWPLVHLLDLTSLYMTLLKAIISSSQDLPPYGKVHGYYFAENGTFSWKLLSQAISDQLASRGLIKATYPPSIRRPTEEDLVNIGRALGDPPSFVPVSVGGQCALRGDNGRRLGWSPKFGVEHLMSTVQEEVEFVLAEDQPRRP